MKIDFDEVLKELDGTPIIPKGGTEPLTMKKVCIVALTALDDKALKDGDTRYDQGILAQKIYGGGSIDISLKEASMLKELIGIYWSPIPVMRAWNILDPIASESEKGKKKK